MPCGCTGGPGARTAMLRLALHSARVRAEWVNIWEEPAAAAAVRQHRRQRDRPTVAVGATAMVNPPPRQVIATVRASSVPAKGRRYASWFARGASFLRRRSLR